MKKAIAGVQTAREVCNSAALRPFVKREVMPGNLDAAGLDAMAVVDAELKVYGVDGLRVADGSIMPRITVGNTMAPCVVIGERAAEALKLAHRL